MRRYSEVKTAADLVVFGTVRSAFGVGQFGVELLLSPHPEFGRRADKANVDLTMNDLTVDVRTSLCYLQRPASSTHSQLQARYAMVRSTIQLRLDGRSTAYQR